MSVAELSDPVPTAGARWALRATPRSLDPTTGALLVAKVDDFIVPDQFEATVLRTDVTDWPQITMQIEMRASRPVIRELTITTQHEVTNGDVESCSANGGHTARIIRSVNATLLRELPLARLAKQAMLCVAWRVGEGHAAERVVGYGLRDDAGFYAIGPDEVTEHDLGQYRPGRDEIPADASVYSIDHEWEDPWSAEMQALAAAIDRQNPPARRNRITDELLAEVAEVYRQAMEEDLPPKKEVSRHFHVAVPTAGHWIGRSRRQGFLRPTLPGKKGESDPEAETI